MKRILTPLLTVALIFAVTASSSAIDAGDKANLAALYEKVKDLLEHPTPERPFYLEVGVRKHIEHGEAALYFPESFDEIAKALSDPANWCDLLPLHLNVKGCTYRRDTDGSRLRIYLGRKFYQSPEKAHKINYDFHTVGSQDYFAAIVTADKGPLGTSDYRIVFEAMPADGRTFGRVSISDHQSWISSKAMHVYLATKGKHKQGISVIGHDEDGNPIYSKGEPAVAERNLLRYYFAFAAFFNSAGEKDNNKRHENQMNYWFDQTEQYPQLHEMGKEEYLTEKRKERANQIALQREQQ